MGKSSRDSRGERRNRKTGTYNQSKEQETEDGLKGEGSEKLYRSRDLEAAEKPENLPRRG